MGNHMNRLFLIMGLLLIFIMPPAWGAVSRYPDPHRQTMWNDLTDSVHTLGQTPYQTKKTKAKLHAARDQARLDSIQQDWQAKHKAKMKAWQESQQ